MNAPQFEALECAKVIADVCLLIDNECDDGARTSLQAHLDRCSSCHMHYELEDKIKKLIGRKCGGERAPRGLVEQLRIHILKSKKITKAPNGDSIYHAAVRRTIANSDHRK